MKYFYFLLFTVVVNLYSGFAQQASDYFPQQAGFIWKYELSPLDSLNNPIDSLTIFRVDSFATTADYQGKLANLVLTKEGPVAAINFLPYNDSLYYNFDGSDAYEYAQVGRLEIFLAAIDSILADSSFSFLDMFLSFEGWYSLYRFDESVNQDYNLYSIDTTITISSTEIPLRFELIGTRLQDETLNTDIGTFDCKKFLIERGISFLIFPPPPLPPIVIPIAFVNDSIWIAQGNWIVQSIIPTTEIDLTLVGGGIYFLPGLQSKIIADITEVNDDYSVPIEFNLFQNYPNPFNPSTKIRFVISDVGPGFGLSTSLKVYDILGNEIITLVNKYLPVGEYEFTFSAIGGSASGGDASELSSGVYFYQLKAGSFVVTKKMVLIR
jgi:hypothetical protein